MPPGIVLHSDDCKDGLCREAVPETWDLRRGPTPQSAIFWSRPATTARFLLVEAGRPEADDGQAPKPEHNQNARAHGPEAKVIPHYASRPQVWGGPRRPPMAGQRAFAPVHHANSVHRPGRLSPSPRRAPPGWLQCANMFLYWLQCPVQSMGRSSVGHRTQIAALPSGLLHCNALHFPDTCSSAMQIFPEKASAVLCAKIAGSGAIQPEPRPAIVSISVPIQQVWRNFGELRAGAASSPATAKKYTSAAKRKGGDTNPPVHIHPASAHWRQAAIPDIYRPPAAEEMCAQTVPMPSRPGFPDRGVPPRPHLQKPGEGHQTRHSTGLRLSKSDRLPAGLHKGPGSDRQQQSTALGSIPTDTRGKRCADVPRSAHHPLLSPARLLCEPSGQSRPRPRPWQSGQTQEQNLHSHRGAHEAHGLFLCVVSLRGLET